MNPEKNLYYICTPTGEQPVHLPVQVVPVQEFLGDEPACTMLWTLVSDHFRTRGKFLAVWPNVRYVAIYRNPEGQVMGLLLISALVNWQIDYVVVHPAGRGSGAATAMIKAALNAAYRLGVPYVMLTSKESLRPLYEACGFRSANITE
jgi:GNAT superfamily N-acetyltransferase